MKELKLPFVSILKSHLNEKTPLMQFVIGPRQVGKTTGVGQVTRKYPGRYSFRDDPPCWKSYFLNSIVDAVLFKDILSQHKVNKPALFRQLVELLAAYSAQKISYTKLLGQLQERGNVEIIKNYIQLLQGSFLFMPLEKYPPKKVLQKSSSPKNIPMCPALIEALAPEVDKGRRFEAYVGAELIHLNGELFYWQEGHFEVDFVFKNFQGKVFATEVKSEKSKLSASLQKLMEKSPQIRPLIIDEKNVSKLVDLVS